MRNKIRILDCTLRDGGYYNQWDFDHSLVQRYLKAVNDAKVDIIELGFRNFPEDVFFGAFAYTTDAYIDELKIPDHLTVGVMVDASSILNSGYSIDDATRLLFQPKEKSRVDIVRIATHFETVAQCKEIVQLLKSLGYQVGLNLMQINTKTDRELLDISKLIQGWSAVDVLYFADSLGGMDGSDVVRISSILRSKWIGKMGFHAHNNKGLAVSNSLIAMENGVTWIDATILGMGRGAGNAQMENLLLELMQKHQMKYRPNALFDLVLSDFTLLQNQFHWGESLLYRLAAIHNIHPTYIQEMLENNRYSTREALEALSFMSSIDTTHYNKDLLSAARGNTTNKGSWDAKDWCAKKEVLILGSGKSLKSYQKDIIQYIHTYNPTVVSLNIEHEFPKELIDIYASSNESKMLGEFDLYSRLTVPLVVSSVLLEKVVGTSHGIKELWDYGLNIKPSVFTMGEKECTLPYELSIGYALSLANVGGANSISLVGFDGYDIGDARQEKMEELFRLYLSQTTVNIVALTPTTYNIPKSSIYAAKY